MDCGIPIKILRTENGKNITKNCNLGSVVGMETNDIVLDAYLNNILGYIEANYKSVQFINTLNDVNGYDSYIYNPESSELIAENQSRGNIKDFIEEGNLKFLNIPIIGEQEVEGFKKAYEVLDNFDDALEKINGYEMINIICKDNSLYNANDIININDKIIDKFCYSNFCEGFSHNRFTPTYTYLKSQRVIQNDNKKVLPYSADQLIGGKYSFNAGEKIYIKNVLVSEVRLKIPYLVDGIQLKKAVFNIMNKEIVPNVSRNNLKENLKQDLSYAVGKALHLWILDHGNLSLEEKELLRSFIKECYPIDNYCLRS